MVRNQNVLGDHSPKKQLSEMTNGIRPARVFGSHTFSVFKTLLAAGMLITGVGSEDLPCGPTVRDLEVIIGSSGTLTIPTSVPYCGKCRPAL